MADPPKTPNGKRSPEVMPTEKDLVEFHHVAAGHEGMSSNASGSLVIKPCTQAEIDFYESAKDHEHFQSHVPTYLGMLTLNGDGASIAPLLAQAGQPVSIHSAKASTNSLPPIHELFGPAATTATPQSGTLVSPITSKRASWKPSGGKKLNTGLAIVLENVAAGFIHPNILDVKLGARLWADDAPMSKRRKLDDVSKATTSGSLGFRIAGMKMWEGSRQVPVAEGSTTEEVTVEVRDGYRVYNKDYGRALTEETVKSGFAAYLGGLDKDARDKPRLRRVRGRLIAQRMVRELESMQYVLEHEESRMYSASILMVYEGDEEALEVALREEELKQTADAENNARGADGSFESEGTVDGDDEMEEEEEEQPKVQDVRLIDFAHATWTSGQGPDENMLHGIRSVIKILKELAVS